MELIRSVSYPPRTLDHHAIKQAEDAAIANRQLEEDLLAQQRAEKQTKTVAQREQSLLLENDRTLLLENDRRKSNVTQIVIQAPANQSRERAGLPQLPVGQSSSAFLAQQIFQNPEANTTEAQSPVHQQATTAYAETLGLTSTILGLEGFRERIA